MMRKIYLVQEDSIYADDRTLAVYDNPEAANDDIEFRHTYGDKTVKFYVLELTLHSTLGSYISSHKVQ